MSEFSSERILKTDYSHSFDEKRKGLVIQSYFKYGKASRNFATGNVDAIGSLKQCLARISNTCVMLQIMQCSGICSRRRVIISDIPILTSQQASLG